jgi:hypothetical protein
MASIRGVEVGKILMTPDDVLEHCYPELHKIKKAIAASAQSSPSAPSAPSVEVVTPASAPSVPPAPSVKVKAKKGHAKVEETEDSDRPTIPPPEPGSDPLKGV